MFSTRIFLDYFSVKQIITRLELDSFPSPNITLIPFPFLFFFCFKPSALPLGQELHSPSQAP